MEISILTLIFGTVLGVVLALMRDSRVKIVARIAQLYIWIWRGTPLMIQAFLIYFGLPNLGVHIQRHDSRRALHVIKYRLHTLRKSFAPVSMLLTLDKEKQPRLGNALASGDAPDRGTPGNQDLYSAFGEPVYCNH